MTAHWPAYWRAATHPADAEFACALVNQTMSPYWRMRHMAFSRRKFMDLWPKMEAAIIQYSGPRDGFIGWDIQGRVGYLREFHLIEACRGQGLGGRVLDDWIALQRGGPATSVELKVFENNPARRLYERAGFHFRRYFDDRTGLIEMRCTL
ncbi:GNAT family N-acetyltransferase [Larsenimonas salina]|uniref:GNAT family N-acetyltransferase n=1 Tax=Larsenimonas salina TaxID=1295565 RepID=UPI002072F709|nr:GNAT family N-acetyltransferase [Larsenimonas salina]MCM5703574.1 GNAT family N-acetyltransferase [Larsenimonas salina]